MASIKNLKKEINDQLSFIIEECYLAQLSSSDEDSNKIEKIIDKCIGTFDDLISKIHTKDVDSKKSHFKTILSDLNTNSEKLLKELDQLRSS